MEKTKKEKAFILFQNNAAKTYSSLGYSADISNCILGIIITMRDIVLSAESRDTILLHKHMGECAWYIANYASANNIKLADILSDFDYTSIESKLELSDLESYLQMIKDDLSFVKEMSESEKKEFIQKTWVSLFPEDYYTDFLKTDRILKTKTQEDKIKFPNKFLS
jgi:hypothetical protein